MKKTCMLLALFMALAPGYAFSDPPPRVSKIPNLVGYWEGTGKFLDIRSEEVEVTVSLHITKQAGPKFKGKISAYWMADFDDRAYIGSQDGIEVGGHIQGGSLSTGQSMTINMFGGWGWTYDNAAHYAMEIDGQYQAAPESLALPGTRHERTGPALICHWRGMNFWSETDDVGFTGKPSVGDFTLRKTLLVDR
jgi:hypothetical protein